MSITKKGFPLFLCLAALLSKNANAEGVGNLFLSFFGFLFRCSDSPKCFFGFGSTMHLTNGETCKEVCALFPCLHFNADCGKCSSRVTVTRCDDLGECLIESVGLDLGDDSDKISFELTENGNALECNQIRTTTQDKSWHGVCSNGGGTANLLSTGKNSKGEDLIHGSVVDVDGNLICQLSPDAQGNNRVICTPATDFPPEGDPIEVPTEIEVTVEGGGRHRELFLNWNKPFDSEGAAKKMSLRRDGRDLLDDLGGNLDILVVWTIKAECKNSGLDAGCARNARTEANMRGRIDLAIAESNTAFENSGVDTALRLVHAYRDPDYVEASDDAFTAALKAIASTSDGIMDDIHDKRTQFGADIVAMLIDDSQLCGLGYLGPSKEKMFSVTNWYCATGYYSFVHEVAHNMGCHHDRGTAGECEADGYAYGYRDPASRFRSIMAYKCVRGQCDNNSNNSGSHCNRAQMFSNDEFTNNNLPIGNAENNNARQMNKVKSIVAGYYPFKAPCQANSDCPSSDLCAPGLCDGVCKFQPLNCDDNNACTADSCSNGKCVNAPISCDDSNVCTDDTCDDVEGCVHTAKPNCCGSGTCEASDPEAPSAAPSTKTASPTVEESVEPSLEPSQEPSSMPSTLPSISTSNIPMIAPSTVPSLVPTVAHSFVPSIQPSMSPSTDPSKIPSMAPSVLHSDVPSIKPSHSPLTVPSIAPSNAPMVEHSGVPSIEPSRVPSRQPSSMPSNLPTVEHSDVPSIEPSRLPLGQPIAKLTAIDGAAGDYFGRSVAISGDTLVISAQYDDDNGSNSGSAYVFIHSGTIWTEQAKLTASDGALSDNFGGSVAIDGDTIVIGVRQDDDNGTSSGSAYIYTRSGSTWTEQAKLTASDGTANDSFGTSVAISGDTVVVSARLDDDIGINSGSAYIYVQSGTMWTEQAKLTASDGAADDFFGNHLAISVDTIVIGAIFDDDNGGDSGSAYIYTRSGSTWTMQAKLAASDGASNDSFGESVAISGDTIVIGAYLNDDNGIDSGSAYVYVQSGTMWTEQTKLNASDGADNDQFGSSVAISGDAIVIGSHQDDDNGSDSGSAYVFIRSGTTWTEQAKLTASDGAADDWFGDSVAISGDTVVIGAFLDDDNGDSSGSIYVVNL